MVGARYNVKTQELTDVRNQPRNGSQVGGNSGSGTSVSKRAHESDVSDSNSLGSSARLMGRKKKTKKKGKGAALEVVNEDFNEFKQSKAQEFERLEN